MMLTLRGPLMMLTLNQQTELTIIAKRVTESYNNLINNIDSSSSS